jgi:hypothetical protein
VTGEHGYLVDRGLVPLPGEERQANFEKVKALKSGKSITAVAQWQSIRLLKTSIRVPIY